MQSGSAVVQVFYRDALGNPRSEWCTLVERIAPAVSYGDDQIAEWVVRGIQSASDFRANVREGGVPIGTRIV